MAVDSKAMELITKISCVTVDFKVMEEIVSVLCKYFGIREVLH